MTVRDNLAFPLRNRGLAENEIAKRVAEVAEALELESQIDRPAFGLSADAKQKISMGRGLVRTDVSAILLDEPLTVIDPELKWRLRSNLKALHRRFKHTMIYVTHDQTEALTFAERVVVMHDGRIVQEGGAVELFEAPLHKFVGYFIGSPGMNFAACEIDNGAAVLGGVKIFWRTRSRHRRTRRWSRLAFARSLLNLGVRGCRHGSSTSPDVGHYRIAELRIAGVAAPFKAILSGEASVPTDVKVSFTPARTYAYYDGWMAAAA